jgi:predicted house-cleaning NTP pyrophosphatase (Maf/HAM1 superfamily)
MINLLNIHDICPYKILKPESSFKTTINEKPREFLKKYLDFYNNFALNIINSDIVISCCRFCTIGTRIVEMHDITQKQLKIVSGRRIRFYTGTSIYSNTFGRSFTKIDICYIKLKVLDYNEINDYIEINEWSRRDINPFFNGRILQFIEFIRGSYAPIVGINIKYIKSVLNNLKYNQ